MNYDYYFLKSHDSIKVCEKTTNFLGNTYMYVMLFILLQVDTRSYDSEPINDSM